MSENIPTNVQFDANGKGTVTFATDVIATIAGLAATEVEGVANMVGNSSGSIAEIFRRSQNARNLTKGVRVDLNENNVAIHLTIVVDYGMPVPQVAKGIQENVKKAIETMTGLDVTGVNVYVQGVSFEKENRAAAEIEARQRLMLQKKQEEEAAQEEVVEQEAPAEATVPAATEEVEEDEGEYVLELPGDEDETEEAAVVQE